MQMKKKGKVHPSPPLSTQPKPPPSSSYLNEDESLSVLRLLPATILVLVSGLSTEDREVLAYLITRGNYGRISKTKKNNKPSRNNHKPPVFDCECFDCYTNYWLRWDSSPNRELIHEIIEAFENRHLATENSVFSKNNKSKRGKKKEKPGRRVEPVSESHHVSFPDSSTGRISVGEAEVVEREPRDDEEAVVEEEGEESTVEIPGAAGTGGHKGLARKVLPDVLGLLNSSFWRLWNPNA